MRFSLTLPSVINEPVKIRVRRKHFLGSKTVGRLNIALLELVEKAATPVRITAGSENNIVNRHCFYSNSKSEGLPLDCISATGRRVAASPSCRRVFADALGGVCLPAQRARSGQRPSPQPSCLVCLVEPLEDQRSTNFSFACGPTNTHFLRSMTIISSVTMSVARKVSRSRKGLCLESKVGTSNQTLTTNCRACTFGCIYSENSCSCKGKHWSSAVLLNAFLVEIRNLMKTIRLLPAKSGPSVV